MICDLACGLDSWLITTDIAHCALSILLCYYCKLCIYVVREHSPCCNVEVGNKFFHITPGPSGNSKSN